SRGSQRVRGWVCPRCRPVVQGAAFGVSSKGVLKPVPAMIRKHGTSTLPGDLLWYCGACGYVLLPGTQVGEHCPNCDEPTGEVAGRMSGEAPDTDEGPVGP
ncbi:MAG TPA: hypothetical protein VFH61_04790, partial [Thermoleophilia bacterium]|nr:hypothetical protein [Thermoleophilia bacterium]